MPPCENRLSGPETTWASKFHKMPELKKKSSATAPVTPHVWELEGESSSHAREPSPAPSHTRPRPQKQVHPGRTASQMADAAAGRYPESAETARRISTDSEAT